MKASKKLEISFSDETRKSDFYTYHCVGDLSALSEKNQLDIIRCRTVGILHSKHGRFYLTDIVKSQDKFCQIRVSVAFLNTQVQSTVIPYAVQIFGTLEWHNRPVLFARILQTMTTAMAIRMRNALSGVTYIHLERESTNPATCEEDIT